MHRAILLAASALLIGPVAAQDGPREDRETLRLERRLERKLAEPWLAANPWFTSLRKARAAAAASHRPIFAYLTRSFTPCPWCTRCEKGPLSEPAFAKFAKNVVLFAWIDSRLPSMEAPGLMRAVGGKGYPALAFLDPDGTPLYLQKGLEERSVPAFEETRALVAELLDARRAERENAPGACIERVLAELRLGRTLNPEVAKSRLAEAGEPTASQQKRIDAAIDDLQILYLIRRNKRRPARLGKALEDLLERGTRPDAPRVGRAFWSALRVHAERRGDVELADRAKKAYDALRLAK